MSLRTHDKPSVAAAKAAISAATGNTPAWLYVLLEHQSTPDSPQGGPREIRCRTVLTAG